MSQAIKENATEIRMLNIILGLRENAWLTSSPVVVGDAVLSGPLLLDEEEVEVEVPVVGG